MANFFQKIKRCFQGFVADEAPQSAAAISFYAVLAMPPLIVLMVSSAGLLVSDASFQSYLIVQAGQLFGPSGAEIVSMIIVQSQQQQHGWAALMGLLVLVVTSGGLHAQIQMALNKMWNLERGETGAFKRFFGDRLLATLAVAATGLILVLSLVLSTALRTASIWLNERFQMDLISIQRTQSIGTFLLITVLIALIYRLLPDARVAWSDVWRGAFITSTLFAITRHFFAIYLSRTTLTLSYGQAGALVLLLLWIYFSSLILLFGAEWTSIEAEQRGRRIVAKSLPYQQELIQNMPEVQPHLTTHTISPVLGQMTLPEPGGGS
ncbi:MAG: YihY/virulence factor BrkB family protein [Vulcanimicrobiota bacterium]